MMTSVSVVLEDRRRTKRQIDVLMRVLKIQNTDNQGLKLKIEILKEGFDDLRAIFDPAKQHGLDGVRKDSKALRESAFF